MFKMFGYGFKQVFFSRAPRTSNQEQTESRPTSDYGSSYQAQTKSTLVSALIKQGIGKKSVSNTVYSNKKTWKLSHTRAVERAYPNIWFIKRLGQEVFSNLELEYWLPIKEWVKLT